MSAPVPWWAIPLTVVYVGDSQGYLAYVADRAELAWNHGGVRPTRIVQGQRWTVGQVTYIRIGGTRRTDADALRGRTGPAAIVWGNPPARDEVRKRIEQYVEIMNASARAR